MNYRDEMKKLISDKKGVILTSDLSEYNIPRYYLEEFVRKGLLEKIDRGAYISIKAFDDEMYRLQMRFKPIIYSHDTALYFNGLSDRDPIGYTVTVYSGYSTARLREMGVNTFSIKRELFDVGLSYVETVFGHRIRAYNAERAICDCIRNRSKMDIDITVEAIKRYVKRKDKDIPKLLKYAELFRVTAIIKRYLEVLL